MKVAVTGSNGLAGQFLVKLLLDRQHEVIAIGLGEDRCRFKEEKYRYFDIDITDSFALSDVLFSEKPDVLVHGAAVTQADDCHLHPEHCRQVNESGTMNAIIGAEMNCRHFIFLSTDFVFDGIKGNYQEEDITNPVSLYGETKLKGEMLTRRANIPWTIIRTCLVYGQTIDGTRGNIISWVKESLEKEKNIRVVSDQYRTPTYAGDLAMGIVLVIEKKAEGVFHISGKEGLSPFEMALKTAHYFGLDDTLIERVDASSFTQPARRPPRTGFDISKARNQLGYEPLSFEEGLARMYAKKQGR